MRKLLSILFSSLLFINLLSYKFNYKTEKINQDKQNIIVSFILDPEEIIYKDTFSVSANNPEIKVSTPKTENQATNFFDKSFNTNKEGYKNTVNFNFTVEKKPGNNISEVVITNNFIVNNKEPKSEIIALNFSQDKPQEVSKNLETTKIDQETSQKEQYTPKYTSSCPVPQPSLFSGFIEKIVNYISQTTSGWKNTLSNIFSQTGSFWIRFIIALILGILLSLTPCIYPMIPITIGVLQNSHKKTFFSGFLVALTYTLGISTTFAVFGLIAALGSCVFGELQSSPLFIIPLVLVLGYLGLSMFGLYEMYTPKFLQPKKHNLKSGSYLSTFLFGAISGTVASPCLSPGLALILNYVASLSNYFEGFVLLFVFGIGSSLPLLIIGTFSSSLQVLPKAGVWMVEIKKLVGLMLIAMCFYHLSQLERIFPWHILIWFIVATLFAIGIYYFSTTHKHDSRNLKRYKSTIGTLFILLGCIASIQGLKAIYAQLYPEQYASIWINNYQEAKNLALKENKKTFLDIGATTCAACKNIDKTVFKNPRIMEVLRTKYIPVKVESNVDIESYELIKKDFNSYINGFPTYLIIDNNNQVVKKWNYTITDLTIDQIEKELEEYSK